MLWIFDFSELVTGFHLKRAFSFNLTKTLKYRKPISDLGAGRELELVLVQMDLIP